MAPVGCNPGFQVPALHHISLCRKMFLPLQTKHVSQSRPIPERSQRTARLSEKLQRMRIPAHFWFPAAPGGRAGSRFSQQSHYPGSNDTLVGSALLYRIDYLDYSRNISTTKLLSNTNLDYMQSWVPAFNAVSHNDGR
ncbi:hypothetical protein MTR_5g083485 [Medicago truncatula]|uniref:Uncharacterized protein n=1 Tax=Medicago truncatula TaxID=3880 RepID=A0A072UEV7_MEDTR|nr:hypothetical protein MTR_5g083485 [Medicago truncatula]